MRLVDGLNPPPSVYDSLFDACEAREDFQKAAFLIADMRKAKIAPAIAHQEILISTAVATNHVDQAIQALYDIVNIDRSVPSMRGYNSIFQWLSEADQPVAVIEVLKFMTANGQEPDSATFALIEKMRRYDVVLEGIQLKT